MSRIQCGLAYYTPLKVVLKYVAICVLVFIGGVLAVIL